MADRAGSRSYLSDVAGRIKNLSLLDVTRLIRAMADDAIQGLQSCLSKLRPAGGLPCHADMNISADVLQPAPADGFT